jgi:hypothetical protein
MEVTFDVSSACRRLPRRIKIGRYSTNAFRCVMLTSRQRIMGLAMKLLQIVPRDGTRLYSAMIRKQAEIRRSGRGTFLRAGARKRNAARWTHVRYKGSINLEPGPSQAVEAVIKSTDRGDEARLLSSFLGWLDRHFGEHLSSVNIEYRKADGDSR